MSYEYETMIIELAERYISEGKFYEAYTECLLEHNHGHSGWVGEIPRIFETPRDQFEIGLRDRLIAIHLFVAEGLIEISKPSDSLLQCLNLIAVAVCLKRIVHEEYPKPFENLKTLVQDSVKIGAKPKWFMTFPDMKPILPGLVSYYEKGKL